MSYIERAKRKVLDYYYSNQKISPPTPEEVLLIDGLRKRVENLTSTLQLDVNSFWVQQRKQLLDKILRSDPRNFLSWNEIKQTMFNGGYIGQLEVLKKSPYWNVLSKAIIENGIGNPPPFYAFPKSSGNLIHHAFSLNELITKSNCSIENLKNVFEFGGGYGSFCRLFMNMGFNKSYTIFDLPELNVIQEFYFKNIALRSNNQLNTKLNKVEVNSINLINDIRIIEDNKDFFNNAELFIALWSLSESPVSLRDRIIELLPNVKIFFIGFQKKFNGVDNEQYFEQMKNRFKNYSWIEYDFPYMMDNRYLIGIRNSTKIEV